ncbi:hypothetical protein [Mycobacterium marinum]|uniref:hypothetical protein n=1 Tax=Mycobacterium marinum TaxID=1781 RepID=UPI00115E7085|nr:hypothetical protein [Mycobacterium marinum]
MGNDNSTYSSELLDGHCLSEEHPWSILDISSSDAQLAGVFAGFMIVAITTFLAMSPRPLKLFDARGERTGVRDTIILLGLGMVVLGQDAYYFGSVAATKPPNVEQPAAILVNSSFGLVDQANPRPTVQSQQIAQGACEKAWLLSMPAVGMLALGAVLLVAGLGWMIAAHGREDLDEPDKNDLASLANWAFGFVLAGALAFLAYDSKYFVEEMHGELAALTPHVQAWEVRVAMGVAAFVLLIAILVLVDKLAHLNLNSRTDSHANPVDPGGMWVKIAAGGTLGYLALALVFTLFSGTSFMLSCASAELWCGIGLCLLGPGIVSVLIALAMPGEHRWSAQVAIGERGARRLFDRATGHTADPAPEFWLPRANNSGGVTGG